MTPERRRWVEDLYPAALARDVRDRAPFFRDARVGDDPLRWHIESLLAGPASVELFLGNRLWS